jgi:hypothetical protein
MQRRVLPKVLLENHLTGLDRFWTQVGIHFESSGVAKFVVIWGAESLAV